MFLLLCLVFLSSPLAQGKAVRQQIVRSMYTYDSCVQVRYMSGHMHALGERLSEFVRHYEPLLVKAHWGEETSDHIQSKFKFHAHGR